ncbi:MAG: hypothetical protein SNH13_01215 [Rikenellaceae bacterium]
MKRYNFLRFVIFAVVVAALGSCMSIDESKVGFVSVEKVRLNNINNIDCDLRLYNNLSFPITLSQGRIELLYKDRTLTSLNLAEPIKVEPTGEQSLTSHWLLQGEAASLATSLAVVLLGRKEDDLYINFEAKVSARGVGKTIERRRVPAKSFIMGINSLLL